MIELELSRGLVALIDDEDAHLTAWKWSALEGKAGVWYAVRKSKHPDGRTKMIRLHRAVMNEDDPSVFIDHKDGDGLNCTRGNLRRADRITNGRNATVRKNNSSGFVGVGLHTHGRWRARIRVDGRVKNLGLFDTAEEANAARLSAEREAWGVHPRREAAHAAVQSSPDRVSHAMAAE